MAITWSGRNNNTHIVCMMNNNYEPWQPRFLDSRAVLIFYGPDEGKRKIFQAPTNPVIDEK